MHRPLSFIRGMSFIGVLWLNHLPLSLIQWLILHVENSIYNTYGMGLEVSCIYTDSVDLRHTLKYPRSHSRQRT